MPHVAVENVSNRIATLKSVETGKSTLQSLFSNAGTSLLLILAILLGSTIGWAKPDAGVQLSSLVDPLILILVSLIFFEVNMLALRRWRQYLRVLSIAWVCNFIIIPTMGFGIASLFLSGQPLLLIGLVIYFMAPCTDWFLGFIRMARGNVALGTVLLPLNLISQPMLYPLYLHLFAGEDVPFSASDLGYTLWNWFGLPLLLALVLHFILRFTLSKSIFEQLLCAVGRCIPVAIAVLVICLFAVNIGSILEQVSTFVLILGAVFVFFVLTYLLAEGVTKVMRLDYPDHVLLTITTAARNAPLMLGITMAALPEQPLIYSALIIGMLVEFPHLTMLKHLLLHREASPFQSEVTPKTN